MISPQTMMLKKMSTFESFLVAMVALLCGVAAKSAPDGPREYCFPAGFNASCGPNDVILMKSARYGRMKEGQCIQTPRHLGCWGDVLIHVDRICSGRHNCLIPIPDPTLHNLQPCPKDLLAYIEAEYECLPIHREPSWDCRQAADLVVPGPSGYLASITTIETDLGSRQCPWKITVAPGQRINVTLLDFGVVARKAQSGAICPVYANIREQGMASPITVCGGQSRERGVYVSETNEIEAVMLTSVEDKEEQSPVYFVLKYDVVGCTDPVIPQGAWLKRTEDSAVIGCNHTTQAWHIVCHGNDWFGKVENCTSVSANGQSDGLASSKGEFPYGLMVAVVTGLVLGVLIGVALLAAVIVCHKRKRRGVRHPGPADSQDAVLETVQGTPFLREKQGNKPPHEPLDGGYGYTHVCDVTIYQPYTQQQQQQQHHQRQMSSFRNLDVAKHSPPPSQPPEGLLGPDNPRCQPPGQQLRAPDLYEKPGLYRKHSLSCTGPRPGEGRTVYSDFDILDHHHNVTNSGGGGGVGGGGGGGSGSPAHKIMFPSSAADKLNTPCEH